MPLRADAARLLVSHALDGVAGVRGVTSHVEQSTPVITVQIDQGGDVRPIEQILRRYTVAWRLQEEA